MKFVGLIKKISECISELLLDPCCLIIIYVSNNNISVFREIVFGEHTVGTDPDCINGGLCSAKKITRKPDQIIIHEDYLYYGSTDGFYNLNDIALIRLNESVPLYSEDPEKSSVIPICLPWDENSSARNLNDDTNVIMTGWEEPI